MKSALIAIFLSVISFGIAASEPTLNTHFTDAELIAIIKEDGYRSVELDSKGIIVIKVDGAPYVLYNYDDGDLQLYYGIAGAPVSLTAINEWNMSKRLTRAYIDSENDPVLEADLLSDAGISEAHITRFFDIFLDATQLFREFVHESELTNGDPETLANFESTTI